MKQLDNSIRVEHISELVKLLVELTKQGVLFTVSKDEQSYWLIQLN